MVSMEGGRIEEKELKLGLRERQLKESCKELGENSAIYHGGYLEE